MQFFFSFLCFIKTIPYFSYGGSLSSVIINNPTPPNLAQNGALFGISSSTLHVPVGAKAAYQSAAQWQNFGTIVEDAHLYSAPYEVVTGEDLSAVSTEVWLQGDILHVFSDYTLQYAKNIVLLRFRNNIQDG